MQVLLYVLCFLGGVLFTVIALFIWAWYLGMQERIRRAEAERKEMEDAIKAVEAQQKEAAEQLQKSIAELVKRRQAHQQAAQAPAPQVPIDPNVAASVKERLRKAVELTARQSKIDTKRGPEFVMHHNELELEKLAVLKTILADGFDPLITIRFDRGDQEMLLSAYVQSISKGLA